MRRFALALALMLCAAAASSDLPGRAQAQNPDAGPGQRGIGPRGGQGPGGRGFPFRGRGELPTGTASIHGRVVAADTGMPVRRAQVRASANGAGQARLASTDSDGRFELRDLPAGQWMLSASKPGFVTQRLGQRRAYETVAPIDLADAQRFTTAMFSLARGGAITGRVLDDFGDPLANARVQVLRSQVVEGRRRLVPSGISDESDDTGAFRLYGLAPGDYYVGATLRANPLESSTDQTGYAPTFFPGTGNAAEAQRITIASGEEQANVSFALQPVRTVRVSGSVTTSGGAPLTGGVVALEGAADTGDATAVTAAAGRVLGDGSFAIANVAPGSYTLNVRTGPGGRGPQGGAGSEPEVASLPLVVGTEDIVGLSVATSRGASIEGTVVLEGSSSAPALVNLQVNARALRASLGAGGGRTARVTAAGSFRLASLIGPHGIRVDGLPSQWTVRAIELNGTDVIDTSVDFRGTEQITNARIVLTDRVTEVNGVATLGGQATKDYSVLVFADDAARWRYPSRYVRSARGNPQGGFTVRGLPPNERYLAMAVDYLEDGEFQDPEFLARMRDRATSFLLRDGETKTLDLRVVER